MFSVSLRGGVLCLRAPNGPFSERCLQRQQQSYRKKGLRCAFVGDGKMTDVEGLTDAELRTKLMEFGFPVMPITGTTRKVMVKKLKLLMENKGKGTDRRSLAQFSSEEDSDTDLRTTRKDKNRRATMAVVPPMQPPANAKITTRKKRIENDVDVVEVPAKNLVREEKKTVVTTRTSRLVNMAMEKQSDTNSDSEPDIVETDYKIPPRTTFEKRDSPIKSTISSSTYSYSPPTKDYSPPRQPTPRHTSYLSSPPTRYSTYGTTTSDASEKLNQIRSRLSLGSTGYDSQYLSSSSGVNSNSDNGGGDEAPFLSNFTKRLSQLSSKPGDYDVRSDVIKEHDTNGSGMYTSGKSYLSRPKSREYARDFRTSQERNSKANSTSVILVSAFVLFFVILAALYWGMHSGNNNNEVIGSSIPICDDKTKFNVKGRNCITETDVDAAIELYKIIKPELTKRALAHRCSDMAVKPFMTEDNIVNFIREKTTFQDEFLIRQDLNNFMILLFSNPIWEISVLQSATDDFSEKDRVAILHKVYENKQINKLKTSFAVLEPSLPITCTMYRFFAATLKTVLLIALVSGILLAAKRGYRYYKHYEQQRKEEVVLTVEKILDALQTNASEESDNFLVINHVRDMILPVESRKPMEQTWKKAVDFINENESRVRTEVQLVHGEPYEVWRWVGGLNTSASKNKSWQGQAFETQIGSVNSPPCSPTPCLKIRGMVEDGDRNLHTIKEAVLVKCAEQCRILHCAIDVPSKCVYLKCADQNDAAIAYRNLHGWWYAGHLVTVKYIRLERHMQRFPDAPQSGPPYLKPHQPVKEWLK